MSVALQLPEPVGKQVDWLASPATRKVLRVGRRGGKTRFAFMAALLGHGPDVAGHPSLPGVLQGGDVVWISPSYANLSTVLWREEIVPRMAHLPWVHLDKALHDVTIPGLGALLLRSGDRDAIDNVRGVGKRLRGVIVDEAAHMDLRGALQDIILPACLDNGAWLILMSTTNAGKDGGYDDTGAPQVPSYFNLLCGQIQRGERSAEWAEFTGTAYDNPELDTAAIDELVSEYPPGSPKLDQEVYVKLLETGVGLALPGLGEQHVCPAFTPPQHWPTFAGFDWAFYHNWVFGVYVADEDGAVYKRETVIGRLDLPDAIDRKVRAMGIDPTQMVIHAGPDVYTVRQGAGGQIKGQFTGPTIAEQLQRLGWRLIPAANSRVAGLNNIRQYTFIDPARPDVPPRFRWMDTPNNRAGMAQCGRMTLDPNNPEDALKVDADASGRGGDDIYDETRYGLMSRPILARPVLPAEREGVSLGMNWETGKPRERETGESLMSQWIGEGRQGPTVGRYLVPVRRGR